MNTKILENNNKEGESAVFIHSLFRSGSTYIFNVFRRSDFKYYCYQEPLNEYLSKAAIEPSELLAISDSTQKRLRHPKLDKPCFFEFYEVAGEVARYFCKGFSYDQYFTKDKEAINSLNRYFNALEKAAKGRAVFQCCRTSGRIESLKTEFGGKHIFLWRNPWDQWWSYQKEDCFDISNLLILNADKLPKFLNVIKIELNIPSFHDEDQYQEYVFFKHHRLDSVNSYKVFYALWCHAMLEAKLSCELSISIDHLSTSGVYHNEVLTELKKMGITGVNFSDCSVPMAVYGESDRDFFLPIENYVHRLLLLHGYSNEQLNELKKLSSARKDKIVDTSKSKNFLVRDAMRAREYLKQANSEIVNTQNLLINAKAEQVKAEQVKAEQVKAEQAKAEQAKAKEIQFHAELHAVYNSLSWQITTPLRWAKHQVRLARQHGVFSRVKSLVKKILLHLDQSVGSFLGVHPKLRHRLILMTKKLGLYHGLKSFYFRFSTNGQPTAGINAQANVSMPLAHQNLTPHAREIFHNLKSEIEKSKIEID